MTRDELYPVIDEVLHERTHPYSDGGSAWITQYPGDGPQLCIHELAEALCDALCKAVGDLRVERDALRLIANDMTVEMHRLRAAGDALAAALRRHQMACGVNDASATVAAWEEACRER